MNEDREEAVKRLAFETEGDGRLDGDTSDVRGSR
jgi:hypothetical protein